MYEQNVKLFQAPAQVPENSIRRYFTYHQTSSCYVLFQIHMNKIHCFCEGCFTFTPSFSSNDRKPHFGFTMSNFWAMLHTVGTFMGMTAKPGQYYITTDLDKKSHFRHIMQNLYFGEQNQHRSSRYLIASDFLACKIWALLVFKGWCSQPFAGQ